MRVVEVPTVVPGQCFVCMTPNHPPFVDLEWSTEYEDNYPFEPGALYVCSLCVTLMGEALGILTRDSVEELEKQISRLKKRNYELELQNDHQEKALGNLVAAGRTSISADIPHHGPVSGLSEAVKASAGVAVKAKPGSGSGSSL